MRILFRIATLSLLVAATLGTNGCGRSPSPGAKTKQFTVRGIVRGFSPDRSSIDLQHEQVPDYMPAMTMPFAVREPKTTAALKVGDSVSFHLVVDENEAVIDRIEKIPAEQVHLVTGLPEPLSSSAATVARLRNGDELPGFSLTNQNGETITPETFHGKPLVLTFIFTRCPIPNFCPLMSRNFAELQNAIKNGAGALAQTKLLSISFDPDHDTPQVLKTYAASEQADPTIWSFATARQPALEELTKRFAVTVQAEAGSISHGLSTALIDNNGRIVEIWRGNGWKPEEVVTELQAFAGPNN